MPFNSPKISNSIPCDPPNPNNQSHTSQSFASSSTHPSLSKSASSASLQPAIFVSKLYRMVEDSSTNPLIRWGSNGDSFIVLHPEEFARKILPRFFKHNNFSSFVRQLNMYGFHKVPHIQPFSLQNTSRQEPFNSPGPSRQSTPLLNTIDEDPFLSNQTSTSAWEFSHDYFKRFRLDLLLHVRRKITPPSSQLQPFLEYPTTPSNKPTLTPSDMGCILNELNAIRIQQQQVISQLNQIGADQSLLWSESISARERAQHQQEMIEKILRFLASVFTSDKRLKDSLASLFNTLNLGNISSSTHAFAPDPHSFDFSDKFASDRYFSPTSKPSKRQKLITHYPNKLSSNENLSGETSKSRFNNEGNLQDEEEETLGSLPNTFDDAFLESEFDLTPFLNSESLDEHPLSTQTPPKKR